LEGILFVLPTGCRWRDLPPQLGYGSGHTAWRGLRAWQAAGVWDRLHRLMPGELSKAELIDWSRGCTGSVSVRAKGGELTGRNPADRGKPGTKHHLLAGAGGLILHTLLSPANIHDSMLSGPVLETSPGVRGHRHRPGRPRRRPGKLHAGKGYGYPRCRRYLQRRGIKVRIAAASPRGTISAGFAGSPGAASPGCCGSSAPDCAANTLGVAGDQRTATGD